MTVQDMHYDFKSKFNKVDSLSQRDFLVPEIDWLLNEAQLVFVKQRYGRANSKRVGFEVLQKRIDDLRVLVVKNKVLTLTPGFAGDYEFLTPIEDITPAYLFALRVRVRTQLDSCDAVLLKGVQVEHDDLTEVLGDPFYGPSYLWREVPVVIGGLDDASSTSAIYVYADATFTPTDIVLDYLRHPKRIGNPDGFRDGEGYVLPNGDSAVQQSCELPDHTHTEIVDIAVKIAAGNVMSPQYAVAKDKLTDNE